MRQTSFSKVILAFIAILLMANVGYAGWSFWRDAGKLENQERHISVKKLSGSRNEQITDIKGVETLAIDASRWRVYRNNQHRYEIAYPPGSTIRNYGRNTILIDIGGGAELFSITVTVNPQHVSAKQWVEQIKAKARREEDAPLPVEQVFPDRGPQEGPAELPPHSGYRLRVFAIDHEKDLFFFAGGDFMYELGLPAFDPNDPEFEKHHQILLRILETFRLFPNS